MKLIVQKHEQVAWFQGFFEPGAEIWTLDRPHILVQVKDDSWPKDRWPIVFFLQGLFHRKGGPAVILPNGNRYWYFRNSLLIVNDMVAKTLVNEQEEEFVCQERPDLIDQIPHLHPRLKVKYQHELELTGFDV